MFDDELNTDYEEDSDYNNYITSEARLITVSIFSHIFLWTWNYIEIKLINFFLFHDYIFFKDSSPSYVVTSPESSPSGYLIESDSGEQFSQVDR